MCAMLGWFNEARVLASRGTREPLGVAGERLGQDLHRDIAIELRIARTEYLAHPATPIWR